MELIKALFSITLMTSAIRLATPIILIAIGAALCNKAGVLNLALDGMTTTCAFVAIVATYLFRNFTTIGINNPMLATYFGVLAAMLFGALIGALLAFVHTKYNIDLVLLSIALNMLAVDITVYLMRAIFNKSGTWSDPSIKQLNSISLPLINKIPILGDLLSNYNIIVYLSWIITIVLVILVNKTKFGLHVNAVGENPKAASSVGIEVAKMKYIGVIICGGLAGLGGAYISIDSLNMFVRNMSAGRGYIAVAIAILSRYHPINVLFAGLLFGFFEALQIYLQGYGVPSQLMQMIPYIVTLLVLVFGVRNITPPAGLGAHADE